MAGLVEKSPSELLKIMERYKLGIDPSGTELVYSILLKSPLAQLSPPHGISISTLMVELAVYMQARREGKILLKSELTVPHQDSRFFVRSFFKAKKYLAIQGVTICNYEPQAWLLRLAFVLGDEPLSRLPVQDGDTPAIICSRINKMYGKRYPPAKLSALTGISVTAITKFR
jgi:hypothetical protein